MSNLNLNPQRRVELSEREVRKLNDRHAETETKRHELLIKKLRKKRK
jgi:hypothetical protein